MPTFRQVMLPCEVDTSGDVFPGKICKHSQLGLVFVVRGSEVSNGRVSNFWYWRRVLPDGSLYKEEAGYWK